MQVNRLFEIVYILLGKRSVTAGELAERFGVSTRTIYRDIDVLSLSGIPVYTEQGKNGGISLLPDYVLDKSILSEQEQTEILSALQGLASVQTADSARVLQKLSTVFNKSAANWLEVDFSDWSYENGDVFHVYKTAILERRVLAFDYCSTYGERTARRVEPIQLWFKSRAWYLKAFCLMRNDMRLFKLTRVRNLSVTEESFGVRNLLAVPAPAEPVRPSKPDVTIRLRIAPELSYRVYDEFSGLMEIQPDGSFLITVTWPEDEWVYGTLLSFGAGAEVLSPPHIRAILRERAAGIKALYT